MFGALAGGVVDWFGFQVAFLFFLTLSAGTALHVWTATFTGALREHQFKEQPKWDQDQGDRSWYRESAGAVEVMRCFEFDYKYTHTSNVFE